MTEISWDNEDRPLLPAWNCTPKRYKVQGTGVVRNEALWKGSVKVRYKDCVFGKKCH